MNKISTSDLINEYKSNLIIKNNHSFVKNLLNTYNTELLLLQNFTHDDNDIISLIYNKPQEFINKINIDYVQFLQDTDDKILFLYNDSDKFVIKIASNFDILHQGIIGLLIINKIRKVIPTFIYTYGFISIPKYNDSKFIQNIKKYKFNTVNEEGEELDEIEEIDEEGKEIDEEGKEIDEEVRYKKIYKKLCKNRNIGLVLEHVEGKSLDSIISILDEIDIYHTIMIVLNSIHYANKLYNFVHWDLHCGNIIMKEYKEGYIKINDDYFKTPLNYIPIIFDFGMSSYKYDGKDYYNEEFPEYGVNKKNNIIVDYIKFLYSILKYNVNNKVKLVILKIIGLVIENPLEANSKVLSNTYLIMPNSNLIEYTSEQFIENVKIILKKIGYYPLIKPPTDKILEF